MQVTHTATATYPGHLVLIMAPSGSGKGVLIRRVREAFPSDVHYAISCTTRQPREGEKDGEVYYFLSDEEFEARIERGEFLEWAEFGGNRYGTLKEEILSPMREGKVVVREVELQGVEAISSLLPPSDRTVVYIEGGDWNTLKRRITARAPITEEELALRYERYLVESAWKSHADMVIVNHEGRVGEAAQELIDLVQDRLARVGTTTG